MRRDNTLHCIHLLNAFKINKPINIHGLLRNYFDYLTDSAVAIEDLAPWDVLC